MELVSIMTGDSCDAFARYVRPRCELKSVGRGKNVRTQLVNAVAIAKHLVQDPVFMMKSVSKLLHSSYRGDSSDKSLHCVKGNFSAAEFEAVMQRFEAAYVICPRCNKPDTVIKRDKLRCAGCGAKTPLD